MRGLLYKHEDVQYYSKIRRRMKEESSRKVMEKVTMHCTLFNYSEKTETFVGYNFDWFKKNGKIWFIPSVNKNYGYCITTRFGKTFPYEGMNQCGLYIGQTAVPIIKNKYKGLKSCFSTSIICRILRTCKNVEEALMLLQTYSINFGTIFGLVMFHIMVVDASGKSVIIEYIDNEIKQFKKNCRYQVMTNFYISNRDIQWPNPVQGCGGYDRYDVVENDLGVRNNITVENVYSILKKVSLQDWTYDRNVYNTLFSNVYKLNAKELYVVYDKNYNKITFFRLDEELGKGIHYYKIQDL